MHEYSPHVRSVLLDAPTVDKTWLCALSCALPLDFTTNVSRLSMELSLSHFPVSTAGHQTRSEHNLWDCQTPVWRRGTQYWGGSLQIWSELWLWGWQDVDRRDRDKAGLFSSYSVYWGFTSTKPEVIGERQTETVLVGSVSSCLVWIVCFTMIIEGNKAEVGETRY